MKNVTLKIVLICMAAVIFITGMGTTLANFCCDTCLDNFLTEIHVKDNTAKESKESNCCSNKKHHKTPTCGEHDEKEKTDCCKIERRSIVLDSFHSKPIVFSPYTWVANCFVVPSSYLLSQHKEENTKYRVEDPPNIRDPRNYLAFISILVI